MDMQQENFVKTIEEAYIFSIDAAFDQHRRYSEISIRECFEKRTPFWSFLNLQGKDDDPLKVMLLKKISDGESPEAMKALLPQVLEHALTLMPELCAPPANDSSIRCAKHHIHDNWCYLHFGNGKKPKSFLDDITACAKEFLERLEYAEKEMKCDTIFTASWLNELPKFLQYFPAEWIENMEEPDTKTIFPTGGYMGQFVNAAGLFNSKVAAYYLENGVLKYIRRESHCSLAGMREHLLALIEKENRQKESL